MTIFFRLFYIIAFPFGVENSKFILLFGYEFSLFDG